MNNIDTLQLFNTSNSKFGISDFERKKKLLPNLISMDSLVFAVVVDTRDNANVPLSLN
jgi:hypothetical protein